MDRPKLAPVPDRAAELDAKYGKGDDEFFRPYTATMLGNEPPEPTPDEMAELADHDREVAFLDGASDREADNAPIPLSPEDMAAGEEAFDHRFYGESRDTSLPAPRRSDGRVDFHHIAEDEAKRRAAETNGPATASEEAVVEEAFKPDLYGPGDHFERSIAGNRVVPDQPATQRQLRYLQAVAREAGYDMAALDNRAQQEFGVAAIALTRRDASTLIDLIQSDKAKWGEA